MNPSVRQELLEVVEEVAELLVEEVVVLPVSGEQEVDDYEEYLESQQAGFRERQGQLQLLCTFGPTS